MSTLTPAQAAAEIAALINSRVSSPHVIELEAIITRAQQAPATAAPPALARDIRSLIPKVQAAVLAASAADEAAINEGRDLDTCPALRRARECEEQIGAEFAALCEKLWAEPVTCFEDLLVRAEIAQHEALDFQPPYSSDGLKDPPCYDLEAFGQLTMAVLGLGGLPFSAMGRNERDGSST